MCSCDQHILTDCATFCMCIKLEPLYRLDELVLNKFKHWNNITNNSNNNNHYNNNNSNNEVLIQQCPYI